MKKFRIEKHTKYHTSLESSRREEYEFDILSQVLFSYNLLGLIYYTQVNRKIILTHKTHRHQKSLEKSHTNVNYVKRLLANPAI